MDEFPTVLQSSAGRVKDLASVIHVNSDTSEDVPSLIDQGG